MSRFPLALLPGFSVRSYLSATLQIDFRAALPRAFEESTEVWVEHGLTYCGALLPQSPAGAVVFDLNMDCSGMG